MASTNPPDNWIPAQLNAGDTWKFTISLPIYPASSGWACAWTIINAAGKFTYNATTNTNGTDFDFLVSATNSAATNTTAAPINYSYRVIVTGSGVNAGLQFCAIPPTPASGASRFTVAPNFGALGTFDPRSAAEIELATLQATIATLEADQVYSATFGGQTFTIQDLDKLRAREVQLIERVKRETVLNKLAAGLGSGRQVNLRFVNV